ncbi:Cytochrome c1 heme lyase [Blastocladiella emersonii ATCC 22665]|nr:Cytochrome c1 heme lyase [Blastocladiella emersonii ATCC 22665]
MDAPKCPVDHGSAAAMPAGHPPVPSTSVTGEGAAKCPVDHSKIDRASHPFFQSQHGGAHPPSGDAAKCPVDHSKLDPATHPYFAQPEPTPAPTPAPASGLGTAHDSDELDLRNYLPSSLPHQPRHPDQRRDLPTDREASSIPRADAATPDVPAAKTDADGVWMYPSQQMFFNAMKRKNWNPREEDMEVVVPIHNAVNEMAWQRILDWERVASPSLAPCAPRLARFMGKPGHLTPRAWFKSTFMGYTKPFDRHDWVVDRCGTKVNYVIDFYSGKLPAGTKAAGVVSFYLDVRPKLDTWEGVKLRALRFWGDLLR